MDTNILIIGNGFDIAHGLPTKYTDFLRYCRDYDPKDDPVSNSQDLCDEFESFLKRNAWLKYFLNITKLDDPKTWIDFEKEISDTLKVIENILPEFEIIICNESRTLLSIPNESKFVDLEALKPYILLYCTYDKSTNQYIFNKKSVTDQKAFIDFIYVLLREFTRAFEIYCLKVNEISITEPIISYEHKKQLKAINDSIDTYTYQIVHGYHHDDKLKEIKRLSNEANESLGALTAQITTIDYLGMAKFDCVLSFNYTNTYKRLYGNNDTQYCYIHGKAQKDKNDTNIIFGIDDDLPHGEESSNFKWVRFKKYYQRIIYKTGSEYMDWFESVKPSETTVHIVGHSLDKTDYDILYDIFDNKNVKIIVYYYSPEDFEDKVQKVIQLLAYKGKNGRDELIRRVHGSHWSIKFVDQYDEVDGLFLKPDTKLMEESLNDLVKV